jgi:aminoglycoside 6-adenylyltransferase
MHAESIPNDPVIAHLIAWAEGQPEVRAVVLTSSRAIPNYPYLDQYSDYDVILALQTVAPFYDERGWLDAFGTVLTCYRDPLKDEDGFATSTLVVQYEAGLKIDFSLWPQGKLVQIARQPSLPPEFDAGYRILLDKDGLSVGIAAPTYQGYIPSPPSATRYHEILENFFQDATYVAKYLQRDDLAAAKFILELAMRQHNLFPMLEWLIEIERGWAVKPGAYGRRLKLWLRPALWDALASTYVGPDLRENWEALQGLLDLMHTAAVEVGQHLGFAYPEELEQRARRFLARRRRGEV